MDIQDKTKGHIMNVHMYIASGFSHSGSKCIGSKNSTLDTLHVHVHGVGTTSRQHFSIIGPGKHK